MREISNSALDILKERYFLKDDKGNTIEDWGGLSKRVATFAASCEKDEDKQYWYEQFYSIIKNRLFIPNSPTLMNAGTGCNTVSACVSGDTYVVTINGLKYMSDIQIGDQVLTHTGNFRYVTNKWYKGKKQVYGIYRGSKDSKRKASNAYLTSDHKILNNKTWGEVGLQSDADKPYISDVNIPHYQHKLIISNYCNEYILDNNGYLKTKYNHATKVKNVIENDNDMAWLFGFYIAEGSLSGDRQIRFTINVDETEYLDKITRLLFDKFGVSSNIYYSNHGNWITITVSSQILFDFFKSVVGSKFNGKLIPWWVFNAPQEYIESFLDGIFDGDGHTMENGVKQLALANPTLIYQCVMLLRKLNVPVSYTAYISRILQKHDTSLLRTLLKEPCGIAKIDCGIKDVYDIEVDTDHSFVAGDLICHNCFVIDIDDYMGNEDFGHSITDAWKIAALIGKEGGGIGYPLSKLRPRGDYIKTSGGKSTGPIPLVLGVLNEIAEAVKQGGRRRIAQMGVMRVDHPDIVEFINCKKTEGKINNFNISVGITDKFMDALLSNSEYDLINPKDNSVVKSISAKEIWGQIIHGAWFNGEPGVVFIDTINKYHNLKKLGQIYATNPCGEQPLLPYESCVLGSIDVGKFVEFGRSFDNPLFEEVVRVAVRFLDNMVTLQKAPIREIDKTTKANRKIGLGIMGFADALIKLEIPYGSQQSFNFAETIGESLKITAHNYSCHIAEQKGNSDAAMFYENSMGWLNIEGVPRNACQVSFAPTGTIASIADASFGIEPLYDICFIKNVMDRQIFFVSDVVKEYLEYKGHSNAISEMLNGETIDNIDLPKEIKDVLVTSYRLTPEQHVKMQAVFQKYCDSAISKTINFSNGATHEDVEKAYLMAYELGCKGITVYRDGSRNLQVVEIGKGKSKNNKLVERETSVVGVTDKIETSSWKFYFTANRNKKGEPVEIFIEISDVSPDILSMIDSISRMVSVHLKYSVPLKDIIKQLYKVKNGIPFFYEKRSFNSFSHLIGYLLEKHFLNGEKVDIATTCDKCGVKLVFNSGCVTCPSCGYSKC